MRNLVVCAFYLPLIAMTFSKPFTGVVLWFLLSIGSFHKLAYGFAADLPWAYIVGGITVFSWLISGEKKTKFVLNKPIVMLILWGLWIQVTTLLALNLAEGVPIWEKFMKIWASTLFASMFLTSRQRINGIIAVLAGSVAFYGVKGAFHFLLSGTMQVQGPPDSSLADNNDFGLGCVMMLPFLWYLRSVVDKRWQKNGLLAVFVATLIATFATDSRGAFVGLSIESAIFWWKSRGKIRILIAAATLGTAIYSVLPQAFFDRMHTIDAYQSDASAENRLNNWEHAITVAQARPFLGGGMGTFRPPVFQMFGEPVPRALEAHSIYFQALGDQGYPGLALFVGMWLFTYSCARWVRRKTRDVADLKWAFDLAFYMQISLVAYAACGAFLSQAYADFYYALIITISMTRYIVEKSLLPSTLPAAVSPRFAAGTTTLPGQPEPQRVPRTI